MQEQQGRLEEPLSDLPGPRPFFKKKGKNKNMEEDNKKQIDDIVSKTAEALGTGKAFGGWTDAVEEQMVKVKLAKGKKIGTKSADIGPGGKEYNVKTDAEWDKQNKDKSGTMKGLMTPRQKGTKVGVLSHVETDGNLLNEKTERGEDGVLRLKGAMKSEPPFHGMSQKAWDEAKARREAKKKENQQDEAVDGESMGEAVTPPKKPTSSELKMARYRAKWKPKNLKKSAESSGMGGTITAGVEYDGESMDEAFARSDKKHVGSNDMDKQYPHKKPYAKMTPDERFADSSRRKDAMRQELMKKYKQEQVQEYDGESMDEKIATQPRQLKDKNKEVLVHDSKGKVTTIDKKDLEQYQKDNPGSGQAEGYVGQIGGAVREGWKGAAAGAAGGAAVGSVVPGIGTAIGAILGGLAGYAGGDLVGAVGRSMIGAEKKGAAKKTWADK